MIENKIYKYYLQSIKHQSIEEIQDKIKEAKIEDTELFTEEKHLTSSLEFIVQVITSKKNTIDKVKKILQPYLDDSFDEILIAVGSNGSIVFFT